MRQLRFIKIRSVIAAAAAAGLACGLTATTAYAATSSKAAVPAVLPTTVTWHKIALQNGWKSAGTTTNHFAVPAYAVSGGIVYLDGAIDQPTGTNKQFGVLPVGYRPAHTLYLTVLTYDGSSGSVEIKPNGVMTASLPAGASQKEVWLAALSFPASGAQWTNMALVNGWQSGATKFGTGSPAYTVRSGIVYLAGSMLTTGTQPLATTLPANARPKNVLYITVYHAGGLTGEIVVYPTGTVYSYGGGAAAQTALDGVSYPTAAANLNWHTFTLHTGWSSSQSAEGTGDPQYAVSGPIIYLAGSMNFNTFYGFDETFANIPAAIQTPHPIDRQVYTYGGSTGAIIMSAIYGMAASIPPSNAESFTSLAGVSYPRNS